MKLPREAKTILISLTFLIGLVFAYGGLKVTGYMIDTGDLTGALFTGCLFIIGGAVLMSGGLDTLIKMIGVPPEDSISEILRDYYPAMKADMKSDIDRRIMTLLLLREEDVSMLKALKESLDKRASSKG